MSKNMVAYFLPVWFFENNIVDWNLKWKTANAHQTDAGMFTPIPFIHNNRTEPNIRSDHTKYRYVLQTNSKVLACCFMKRVTNSTAKRNVSREPSEHTDPLKITHTWRAMTYRAGAASPPSQPSLHRPGGFCRSSLIFRRPPCLLRSPCSPWSNRARVKLQRISQIGCKL